jgi:hypothetical protein
MGSMMNAENMITSILTSPIRGVEYEYAVDGRILYPAKQ